MGLASILIETLVQYSGLREGEEIKIPGDAITKAIKKLYGYGLFSDVAIFIDRIEGNKVYLNIRLAERHKLSRLNYIGAQKIGRNKTERESELVARNPGYR